MGQAFVSLRANQNELGGENGAPKGTILELFFAISWHVCRSMILLRMAILIGPQFLTHIEGEFAAESALKQEICREWKPLTERPTLKNLKRGPPENSKAHSINPPTKGLPPAGEGHGSNTQVLLRSASVMS